MNHRLLSLMAVAVIACLGLFACAPATSGSTDGGQDAGDNNSGVYAGPTSASWTKGTLPSSGNTFVQGPASFANHKGKTFVGWGYDYGFNAIGGGGLLVTADDGATWTSVALPAVDSATTQTAHSISGVASDGSRLYVASSAKIGIVVSDDDGATWSTVPAPGGMNVSGFRMRLFTTPGKVWVGGYNAGIFSSSDQGATWTTHSANTGNPAQGTTSVVEADGSIYAGGWGKIYKFSSDSPPQLSPFNSGIPFPGGSNQLLPMGKKLFSISTSSSIHSPGLLYSADLTSATPSWTQVMGVMSLRTLVRYKSALFAFGDSTQKVSLSTDEGATWTAFNQGLPTSSSNIAVGAGYLFAVNSGEIWRTPLK